MSSDKPRYMYCIIMGVTDIERQCTINMEGSPCLKESWMPLIYSLKEHRKPPSKGTLICGNSSLAAVISTPWTTLVVTSSHLFSFLSVQLPHNFLIIFCPICVIILLHFQTFCFVYSSLFQYPTSVLYCVAFCFISFQQFYSISYFLL
jgi:hypothetical protein